MENTEEGRSLTEIHQQAVGEKSLLMRRASMVTLAGVTFLIAIKLLAWFFTDSLSLLSSLVDSGMDLLASLVNFMAIRYALMPPDKEHRFGHGKVEYIAGLGQATFISVTALVVAGEGIRRFFDPVPVSHGTIGVVVMLISIVVTLGMVAYQRHVLKQTDSTAVKADSVHYVMDVLANIAVIISLLLVTHLGWHWADPLFAIGIALYILHGAWEVGFTSFHNLMDHEFSPEERTEILKAIRSHPQVQGFHELKTRRSGILSFIQFHIELQADLPLKDAHTIADEVEESVRVLYPHAEILIHTDPKFG